MNLAILPSPATSLSCSSGFFLTRAMCFTLSLVCEQSTAEPRTAVYLEFVEISTSSLMFPPQVRRCLLAEESHFVKFILSVGSAYINLSCFSFTQMIGFNTLTLLNFFSKRMGSLNCAQSETFLLIQSFFQLIISPEHASCRAVTSHSAQRCGGAGVAYWEGSGMNAGTPGAPPTSPAPGGSRPPRRTCAVGSRRRLW